MDTWADDLELSPTRLTDEEASAHLEAEMAYMWELGHKVARRL